MCIMQRGAALRSRLKENEHLVWICSIDAIWLKESVV